MIKERRRLFGTRVNREPLLRSRYLHLGGIAQMQIA